MKVDAKIYALALYESIKEAKPKDFDLLISNFVKLLARKNILSYLNKIIAEFEKIYNEKEGIANATVYSALALSEPEKRKLFEALEKMTGKKINLTEKVEKSLIGGLKLQLGDIIIDDSILARISSLKNNLLNN